MLGIAVLAYGAFEMGSELVRHCKALNLRADLGLANCESCIGRARLFP